MNQQVLNQLEQVIDKWCGLEAGSYGMGKILKDMWEDAFPVSPTYDPTGILALLEHLNDEPMFQTCPKVGALNRGFFVDGGGIQTFGNLFDYLEECGG